MANVVLSVHKKRPEDDSPTETTSSPHADPQPLTNTQPPVSPQAPHGTHEELAKEPPLPAMLVRARKKAAKPKNPGFVDYLRRPFDGLRLSFWLIFGWPFRKLIHQRYGEILVEWRTGLNVLVGNKKGGAGKTPISVLIVLVLAWLLDKAIVLLDCNPAGGHAVTRLGIKKTATFHELLLQKKLDAIESHRTLSETVGSHSVFRNAYCISWNDRAHKADNTKLTETPTEVELTTIFDKVTGKSHATVMDQGNPLTGDWYTAAVKYRPDKSVAVITFQLDQENSEGDAHQTLATHIETDPTCADRSVLVITNYVDRFWWWLPPARKARHEQIERCAFQFQIPTYRIVIIPRDPAFLSSKEIDPETGELLPRVLDPRKLRLRTFAAAMELLVVIARTSRHFREIQAIKSNPAPTGTTQ